MAKSPHHVRVPAAAPSPPPEARPERPAPKPLEIGETRPIAGADELRGYDPNALFLAIGRAFVQGNFALCITLASQYQRLEIRTREVMCAHGGGADHTACTLDTLAMTITRVR